MSEFGDGQLFDLCVRLFGCGDYDEALTPQPYWKWRALEVTKVKRKREKAGVSAADLAVAAHYCKETGITIMNVAWLYRHLPAALAWDRDRQRRRSEEEFGLELEHAIASERALSDGSGWADRLVRASGSYRREVLEAWKQERQHGPQDSLRVKGA